MFRFFVILLVAAGIAGGVAYYNGWLNEYLDPDALAPKVHAGNPSQERIPLGELLYPPEQLPPLPVARQRAASELTIDNCHAVVPQTGKQEVSSPRDGHLLFVGTELFLKPGVALDPGLKIESVPVFDGKEFRDRKYLQLTQGKIVEYGQVVALVDPEVAIREVANKLAKKKAAEEEYDATKKVLSQIQKQLDILQQLQNRSKDSVTSREISEALASVWRYGGDEQIKKQAIEVAWAEYYQARLLESQHYLKSHLPGKSEIRIVYKSNGEGIKAQEPVMQLWSRSELRVEGSIDSQYASTLLANKNALCYLEPSRELAPARPELQEAHQREVTSVAVCADGEHFVSGSEDRGVYLWKRGFEGPQMLLRHKSGVRTLATSPQGMLLLVGCADGSITLWDLAQPKQPLWVKEKHRGGVTALAFSPDGQYFASGGEDNSIQLWTRADGQVLYPFTPEHNVDDPPQGAVTSLHFTKQCTLIAAARPSALRVWSLHKHGAKRVGEPIVDRSGTVSQLGVSADGRYMLYDKGNTLQLLNTEDGGTLGVLNNLAGSNPFDTLALFSPDGSLMLTGGAGEGRLHLWKTPTRQDRGFQVGELVTKDHTTITCAAFAPAGRRFAVTGSKRGYVHLWTLPDEAAVNGHKITRGANNQELRLDLGAQEINAGKIRIAVNIQTPVDGQGEFLLTPGQRVTVVVELPVGKS